MKESTQKEKVLKSVRDALVNSLGAPFEDVELESRVVHQPDPKALDISFAESFTRNNGRFVFCADMVELSDGLQTLLDDMHIDRVWCGEDFFKGLLGQCGIRCSSDWEDLSTCQAALTGCEVLVARTGSVVLSSRQGGGRKSYIVPPLHIVVASSRQLVGDIQDAFRFIDRKYESGRPSMLSFVTGPSRTADIEKKLVLGAHGPRELFVFLVDTAGSNA
jgi:L-lactate dehydrogenase complex protein LldG